MKQAVSLALVLISISSVVSRAAFGAPLDPLQLATSLIEKRSITPADDGVMAVVADAARIAGFEVEIFDACAQGRCVKNSVARLGTGPIRFAFVGHVDVVPPGDEHRWTIPPFSPRVIDGKLYGRGAADMKSSIAAFLAAAQAWGAKADTKKHSVLLLLTGDEEVGSPQGMRAVLARLQKTERVPPVALIGEASSEGTLGQGLRIGRRGSLNVTVQSRGVQGHVAWPERSQNAVHPLVRYLAALTTMPLGSAEGVFPKTSLQVTNVTVPNEATNVVPGEAFARFNIRFNRQHSGASLTQKLEALARTISPQLSLTARVSGEPYLCEAPALLAALERAITHHTQQTPSKNAGGGVSDGRYLRQAFPVLEFGPAGDTSHQIDEHIEVAALHTLAQIYEEVLTTMLP